MAGRTVNAARFFVLVLRLLSFNVSLLRYGHRNVEAYLGTWALRTATSTFTQLLSSEAVATSSNVALRPQKPSGLLGRGSQDGLLDFSHRS